MARVALAIVAFGVCCGMGQAADIAEIRSRLREIETSISSLSIRYVMTTDASPGYSVECEYLQKGPAMRIIAESRRDYSWVAFDGQFQYAVRAPSDDHSAIQVIQKSRLEHPGRLALMPTPRLWWGLWVDGPNRPLHELLENATILDEHTEQGEPVVSIVTGMVEGPGGKPNRYFCDFVTSRDYAPLTIRDENLPEDLTYVVDEFREVDHPQLGRKISVPWKMSFDEMRLEVREMTINPVLDSSLFVPKPVPGTELYDMTVPGEIRKTIHEPHNLPKKPILWRISQFVNRLQSGVATAARPSPPPSPTTVAVVVGVAVAAVMGLLALLLRRFRRGE